MNNTILKRFIHAFKNCLFVYLLYLRVVLDNCIYYIKNKYYDYTCLLLIIIIDLLAVKHKIFIIKQVTTTSQRTSSCRWFLNATNAVGSTTVVSLWNLDQDNYTIFSPLTKDSQQIYFLNFVRESLKYQDCDSYNVLVNLPKNATRKIDSMMNSPSTELELQI